MPNLAMSIDTLMMSDRLLAYALQIDSRLRHNRAHIIQPILCINSMKFSMIFCSVISGASIMSISSFPVTRRFSWRGIVLVSRM
jgi:hypothetical protein